MTVSTNTQAILLLTAPLILGSKGSTADLLSPGVYKSLAKHLRDLGHQPADLLAPNAATILESCASVVDPTRLKSLLERGFLLSQVVERWQARAIWVVSRADAAYPQRFRSRLRDNAPAILYGCGDAGLLDRGGLAVVGSRSADDALIDYTMGIGRMAARAGRTVVSGGAKGIDQTAMRGATEVGGTAIGVLADSLEKASLGREYRTPLLNGRMVLISPYDPGSGFNVGCAMQRNKLIYALADAALVVGSDVDKGGTWAGATEQLGRLKFIPVHVRSTGEPSAGLAALIGKGATPWPNPNDEDAFAAILDASAPASSETAVLALEMPAGNVRTAPSGKVGETAAMAAPRSEQVDDKPVTGDGSLPDSAGGNPADILFGAVRAAMAALLVVPQEESAIAADLGISRPQAKAWLKRLAREGFLEKKKDGRFHVTQNKLLL